MAVRRPFMLAMHLLQQALHARDGMELTPAAGTAEGVPAARTRVVLLEDCTWQPGAPQAGPLARQGSLPDLCVLYFSGHKQL